MFYRPNAVSQSYNNDDSLVVTNITDSVTQHGGDNAPYGTISNNGFNSTGKFGNSSISTQSQLDRRYSQNVSRNKTARHHVKAHNTHDEAPSYRTQNSKSLINRPVMDAAPGSCTNYAFKMG